MNVDIDQVRRMVVATSIDAGFSGTIRIATRSSRSRCRSDPGSLCERHHPDVSDARKPHPLPTVVPLVPPAQTFLNATSTVKVMAFVLAAAEGDLTRPADAEMAADVDDLDSPPLFGGGVVEQT